MLAAFSFGLLVLVSAVKGDDHNSVYCYKMGSPSCLQDFRSMLNDKDYYWFGTGFSQRCPVRLPLTLGGDTSCINPSDNTTILSRLLPSYSQSDLVSIANNVGLAHVTYSGESARHFSCGHEFPAKTRLPGGLKVEPLQTTTWSLAQTDVTPDITWQSTQTTTRYTVIVLDMGYFFLHGLYINARDTLASATPVYAYQGPKPPSPATNAFLYLVVPQPNGNLDFNTVQSVMFGILRAKNNQFDMTMFSNSLGFTINQLRQSYMMVLNIQGDAFGAEYMKKYAPTDNCPYFISRNPYLHRASQWSRVPMSWSRDVTLTSPESRDLPYVTSLKYAMHVTFNAGDIEFESCCQQTSYIRSQMTPDPFKGPQDHPERPVQVRNRPRVKLTPMTSSAGVDYSSSSSMPKRHTLMMVDFGNDFQDFSTQPPRDPVFIVHWLVTNITGLDLHTGHEIIPYFGSNPFTRDSPRMYSFLLLEESQRFDTSSLSNYISGQCNSFPQRCQYRVNQLLTDWGLTDLQAINWYFAVQDQFARQRIYRTWAVKDKSAVCQGVRGYSWPCPLTFDDVRDTATLNSPRPTFVMTFAVFVTSLMRML